MSILLHVLLFHLKKKTFEWMVEFFFYFLIFFNRKNVVIGPVIGY